MLVLALSMMEACLNVITLPTPPHHETVCGLNFRWMTWTLLWRT